MRAVILKILNEIILIINMYYTSIITLNNSYFLFDLDEYTVANASLNDWYD
jgi:hypothetical protein